MKDFFKVTDLETVLSYRSLFPKVGAEAIPLSETPGRVLAETVRSDADLPGFTRSTMDGYAVAARSTFGASEANPGYLTVKGAIAMGEVPDFTLGPGETAKISTGGMLPGGSDAVVMVEFTEAVDETVIEVYKTVAPGQHVVERGEDFKEGESILLPGKRLRPPETGLLAAFGKSSATVYRKPAVAIISTGDEVVPVTDTPLAGQVRDINSHSLSAMVTAAGGIPVVKGIVGDNYDLLFTTCKEALETADMVILSGGSSVGTRDFTTEVLENLPDSEILVHGISISPGKPTILAKSGNKPVWGLPGHVVSAMVVFEVVTRPFLEAMAGAPSEFATRMRIPAVLSRNVASAQGRVDYIRVRLVETDGKWTAEPVLGKSGMINTMVKADGLVEVGRNTEGLDRGTLVHVLPLSPC